MKPFYKFSDNIFRDELLKEYIIPVAKWFMIDDKPSGYLIPQISGSFWECSLAMDFLLRVSKLEIPDEIAKLIEPKVVNTVRWMIDSLLSESSEEMSWDSAPWDTAVVLRSIINCCDQYSNLFTDDEKKKIDDYTMKITRWLIKQGVNWKSVEGYLTADSTDLAVTLSVLICVKGKYNDEFLAKNSINIDEIIETITNMLLQCAAFNTTEGDNTFKVENWGSVFNIGEVICGLSSFVLHSSNSETKKSANAAILSGLNYIEKIQGNGGITDNSVADSCGILWSYLVASKSAEEYDHDDIMVFKSLCWMCDSNKVLNDGSFLHSSYSTVFYALSLIEAYDTWDLGKKPTNEVYHMVVWLNPNIEVTERARRLDLELKCKNYAEEAIKLKELLVQNKINVYTCCVIIILIFITLVILQLFKAINVMKILNTTMLFSILGIAVVIISSIGKVCYEFLKRKYTIQSIDSTLFPTKIKKNSKKKGC